MSDFYELHTLRGVTMHRDTEDEAKARAQAKANRDRVTVVVVDSTGKPVATIAPQRKG